MEMPKIPVLRSTTTLLTDYDGSPKHSRTAETFSSETVGPDTVSRIDMPIWQDSKSEVYTSQYCS